MTQLLHVAAACAVLAAAPGDNDADVTRAKSSWHTCIREAAKATPVETAIERCSDYERTVVQVYHLLGVRPSQIREMTTDNKNYLRCEIGQR